MKKRASLLKVISHAFLALVIFFLISLISIDYQWIKMSIFLILGTYFFIDLLRLLLIGTRHSIFGAYLLFYLGCLIIAVSVIWLGNILLKVIFNPIFSLFDLEFQIRSLVTGIWQYALSIPAFLIGAVFIISGAIWENDAQYYKWYESLFPKKNKKMFRREFTWEK